MAGPFTCNGSSLHFLSFPYPQTTAMLPRTWTTATPRTRRLNSSILDHVLPRNASPTPSATRSMTMSTVRRHTDLSSPTTATTTRRRQYCHQSTVHGLWSTSRSRPSLPSSSLPASTSPLSLMTLRSYNTPATKNAPATPTDQKQDKAGSTPATEAQGTRSSTTTTHESQDAIVSEKLRRVLRKVPFPVVVVSTCSPTDPSLRRGITVSSFTSISLQPIPLVAFCVKLPSRASTVLHEANQFIVQFLGSDQISHSVAFSSAVPPPASVYNAAAAAQGVSHTSRDHGSSGDKPSRFKGEDDDMEDLVEEAGKQTLIANVTAKKKDSQLEKVAGVGSAGQSSSSPPTTTTSSSSSSSKDSSSTDLDPFEVLGYTTDPDSHLPVLKNTLGALKCQKYKVLTVGDHEMWIGQVEKVLHGEIPDPAQESLLYHDRSYRKVGKRIL